MGLLLDLSEGVLVPVVIARHQGKPKGARAGTGLEISEKEEGACLSLLNVFFLLVFAPFPSSFLSFCFSFLVFVLHVHVLVYPSFPLPCRNWA